MLQGIIKKKSKLPNMCNVTVISAILYASSTWRNIYEYTCYFILLYSQIPNGLYCPKWLEDQPCIFGHTLLFEGVGKTWICKHLK